MRLHRLEVTAFGPFADRVEVDFDALAASGVFLLTGATGAGKTSVLDAVCFALYGQVPGDRAGAKHLRSDHAPADREPRVELELSVGERRFRFARSPAWTRPKRRGTGITSVPAHVVVEEYRGGDWIARTNRLDDAGLLVGDLLGMTCAQFNQVAMLPQGRFQAFLRATSAERHDVLQKLFRTDRFERVERWLVDQRGVARRAALDGLGEVRDVVTRVVEVAASALPTTWSDDVDVAAEDGRLLSWVDGLLRHADLEAVAAAEEQRTAAGAEAVTRKKWEAARDLARDADRGRAAQKDLESLAADLDGEADIRTRLDRHRRSTPLAPLVDRARAAGEDRDRAERHAAAVLAAVPRTGGDDSEPPADDDLAIQLAAMLAEAQADLATAVAFRPHEERRQALDGTCAELRGALRDAEERAADLERERAAMPALLADAEAAVEAASTAVDRRDGDEAKVVALADLAAALHRLTALGPELAAARADLSSATDQAQHLREVHLDVREARINGMAAELAGGLAAGCSCPVCGSADHPAPAAVGDRVVGQGQEEAARRAYEDAAFTAQTQQVRVATLEAEAIGLESRLDGVDRPRLTHDLAAARQIAAATGAAAAGAEAARARLRELRTTERDLAQRLADAADQRTRLGAELDEKAAQTAVLAAERAALLGDGTADLDVLITRRSLRRDRIDEAVRAVERAAAAAGLAEEAHAALTAAATAAGVEVDDLASSILGAEDVAALTADLQARDRRRAEADRTLADPAVRAALEADVPDPAVVAAEHAAAEMVHLKAAAAAAAAAGRSARLAELRAALDEALSRWAPLRDRHRLVAELSSLVEGRSADNPVRMRLAAYVLAERLRQVVAAANERLGRMTDGRFALEHVLDRGVGEQRGGLSLRVRDDWNGVDRDPATLSGGETFVVSLALALGLADTVAHEAGGTDVDTLFIDEGFGALDADTLEDVMDTLDTLRDGGRVVGLVSHVPELRSRIPMQLEVNKGRSGSTLRPVLAGG